MRTIILMPDWDSTLFWRDDEGGTRIDEATLPISAELKCQLSDYYTHYSELYYQDHGGPIPDIERRLLDDAGLQIWQRLRAELAGAYRVLFHSDEFGCDFDSPEEFMSGRRERYA